MSRFGLSDVQAQAILDMQLKRLQGLEREKLEAEYKELEEKIAYYQKVLQDPALVRGILKDELIALRDKYGDDRLTEIQDVEDEIDIEDLIEEEDCCFTISNQGYVKRMSVDTYRTQNRGGRGVNAQNLKDEDFVKMLSVASTHDHILFFTDQGQVHHRKGYQIPEAGRTARGTAMVNILPLEPGESVTAMVVTREFHDDEYLMMVTKNGTVKRLPFIALKTNRKGGIRALTLDEGDHLINVIRTNGSDNILLTTADGMAICFNEQDVRPMGRTAAGVRGIWLGEGDYVVGAEKAEEGKTLLTVTENGYGKQTPVEDYRITNRGGLGIKNYMVTDKTGPVVGIKVVDGTEDLLLVTQAGILIRTPVDSIRTAGRATQGVIVMRFKEEGDHVISLALTDHEEGSAEAEE